MQENSREGKERRGPVILSRSRLLIFGLLTRCPLATESVDACPFVELRRKSSSSDEKLRYAEGLQDSDVRYLLQFHDLCHQNRVRAIMHGKKREQQAA